MFYIASLKNLLKNPFNFLLSILAVFIIYAFCIDSPVNIYYGLINIINSPDILITDYILIGGLGAALVNSASVGTASIIVMRAFKCENKGTNIMAIWLMVGFAFFGKNLLNCAPIILGGYFYARYQKKPFSNYIATTLLSTTLSPAVSLMYFTVSSSWVGILLGLLLGIILGFIMNPISTNAYKSHGGYNMYNVGFAAGIVAIILTALLRNAGYVVMPVSLWSEGNNTILLVFLCTISIVLIMASFILSPLEVFHVFHIFKTKSLEKQTYALVDDAYTQHGETAYLNMGVLGLCTTLLVYFIGGEISGPLIGGIFTIIGFGCLGKTLVNIAPSMIGCLFATYMYGWPINSPSSLLTALFSATLAPISSSFGPLWGIVAGVVHLNTAVKLSEMNGGLSLYNNGLAGGFVAMVIVPVIYSLNKEPKNKHIFKD